MKPKLIARSETDEVWKQKDSLVTTEEKGSNFVNIYLGGK